jgi:hypothetical protein
MALVSSFAAFWEAWPHKRNKATAEKAWKKLNPAARARAIERCADWCAMWRKENPQASHIHAATYLNQRRFDDLDEAAERVERSRAEVAAFWAEKIRAGRFVPASALTSEIKAEMVARNLVSADELRALA